MQRGGKNNNMRSHIYKSYEGRTGGGFGKRSKVGASTTLVIIFFLLSASFLFTAGDSSAAPQVSAVALKVKGPVQLVLENGKKKPLKRGDKILPAHVIDSGKGGHAILQLSDGSKVEVFEATKIEVNKLLPEEESKFSLSLFFGRVVAKLKKLRGDDVVITPTMVAGVRGTEFSVCVAEDGTSVVSVNKGRVAVTTDKPWDQTGGVSVEAGQEVLADKTGAILTPRPMQLGTLEAWTKFRHEKLIAMKADLPDIVSRLEKGVDPNLAILDKIRALPQDRAALLKKLDAKMKELGPADVAERAKLTIQTHMEAANVLSLVRRFRIQRMRLKTTFAQSERLKSLLPSFEEQLGPEFKSVDEGLRRILAREKEVKKKETAMAKDFNAAVSPAQPLIDKFKKPQFGINK